MHCAVLLILPFAYAAINCHEERDRGYTCDKPESRKFYFDPKHNVCQPLFHRGCGGNSNQFVTAEECKEVCTKSGKSTNSSSPKTDHSLTIHACNISTDAKISEKVKKCDNGCPMGYICTSENHCCPTKHHICTLPAESGHEREFVKHYGRYAYVPGLNNCIRFSYFGLEGNFNNFLTYQDCKQFCNNA